MTPIIYSKNNCGPCNMLKLALREEGITYEERNISTSEVFLNELMELGYQSVPIVLVDGKVVANGFEPWKVKEAMQHG